MGKYYAYFSKKNSNREKHDILLMIPIGERWYYIVKKTISINKSNNAKIPRSFLLSQL